MNNTHKVVLTLSMLASMNHAIHARYLNYDRIIQVVAKLKTLGIKTEKIDIFEKDFKSSYVNSWILLPREYNKLSALMLELLDTAEQKSSNQQDTLLKVLEMIEDELKGLINKYGYRKELVALSYRTSELRVNVTKGSSINPLYASEIKRATQDLLAESLLTDSSAESIVKYVKNQTKKMEEKQQEQKKSPTDSDSK